METLEILGLHPDEIQLMANISSRYERVGMDKYIRYVAASGDCDMYTIRLSRQEIATWIERLENETKNDRNKITISCLVAVLKYII